MYAFALADCGPQGQTRYECQQAPYAHDFHDKYAQVSPPTRQSRRYYLYTCIATSPTRPLRPDLRLGN